jgi:hypothetical protein
MLSDMMLKLLTGRTQQGLQDAASLGKSPVPVAPDASNLDKSVHALATQQMSNRIGGAPALGLGFGREVAQGLGQLVQGQPFFGKSGYDPQDMQANLVGFHASQSDPLKNLMSMIAALGVRR